MRANGDKKTDLLSIVLLPEDQARFGSGGIFSPGKPQPSTSHERLKSQAQHGIYRAFEKLDKLNEKC